MIKINYQKFKAVYVLAIVSILCMATGVRAEERLPAAEALSEGTKEFLSDPARTGSLLGSILAGAAVANPLAPLLGSVAGFMIGKSSAFTNKDSNTTRRYDYDNRSLIPENGLEVTGIAGLTGKPLHVSERSLAQGMTGEKETGSLSERGEPIVMVKLPGESGEVNHLLRTEPIVIVESPGRAEAGSPSEQSEKVVSLGLAGGAGTGSDLQKQLAHACSNVKLTQPMPASCYYYSQ